MTFTLQSFQAQLPLLITSATTIVVMLAIAIRRNHWWNATLTVAGLNLALFSSYFALQVNPQTVTPLFVIDGFSIFFSALVIIAGLGTSTLINAYFESSKRNREEIYLLVTIATAGGIVLASSHHMASLFIGLEMMSISLYGMVSYTYDRARSLEATIKYMVLSATSSAILLFGIALIYSQIGSLSFSEIGAKVHSPNLIVAVGGLMLLAGLFFKLSLAPFHLWTPDVYEGAPAPVGAFLATAAKVAVFAVLVRFVVLESTTVLASIPLILSLFVIACLSMLVGNLLALKQNNIKRMLGYSSIAHFGYLLLLVLLGARSIGIEGFAVYLTIYVITSLTAFGVVTLMSSSNETRDADNLADYRGLFWRRPYLASVFTVALFSLAGIPLTAGFIGKFYVIKAALLKDSGLLGLITLIFVVLGSAIGVYFYLRTIISLYLAKKGMYDFDANFNWGHRAGGVMTIVSAVLILAVGIYPQPVIDLAQTALLIWAPNN